MTCMSQSVSFASLVEEINKIDGLSFRAHKVIALEELMKKYKDLVQRLKETNENVKGSLFPIVRLLVPALDRDRGPYNFGRNQFSRIVANVMPLSIEDTKYIHDEWRKTGRECVYVDMIANIIHKYAGGTGLTVYEVNEYLDSLASSNREGQKTIFANLFPKCTPNELKFLVKILFKSLSLNIETKSILNAVHPDAFNFHSTNCNLQKVCDDLQDSSVRLMSNDVHVMSPFRFMLCQRCSSKHLLSLDFRKHNYIIEEKHDGERFQLHKDQDNFKYYSRNAFDYTETFGQDYEHGILTPKLKDVIRSTVKSVILDGEMMGYDPITKQYTTKGVKFDVKKLKSTSKYQPVFIVYDILLLNGHNLMNTMLEDRVKILASIIKPREDVLMVSKVSFASNVQEVIDALNNAVDQEQEGIVIKDPKSFYRPTVRNGGWYKLKIEFFANTMHDLDVLVIGGFFSENGAHAFEIASYLTAVIDNDVVKGTTQLLSFAKVSTGLTAMDKADVDCHLQYNWIITEGALPDKLGNSLVHWGAQKPDFFIQPAHSIVFEIRGSELVKDAKDFATNYTVRFPRIQSIKHNIHTEILTLGDLQCLSEAGKPVQKLGKRHLEMDDIVAGQGKRFKKSKVAQTYAPRQLPEVPVKASFLNGHEFYVLSGLGEWTKEEVEKAILENGGAVVLHPRPTVTCILYGDHQSFLDVYQGSLDIVKLTWLRNVLDKQQYQPYSNADVFYKGESEEEDEDEYNDNYTRKVILDDATVFIEARQSMEKKRRRCNSYPTEITDLLSIPTELKFKNLRAYFDRFDTINSSYIPDIYTERFAEYYFVKHGGVVDEWLTRETNLVVMKQKDLFRGQMLEYFIYAHFKIKPKIVCEEQILYDTSELFTQNENPSTRQDPN